MTVKLNLLSEKQMEEATPCLIGSIRKAIGRYGPAAMSVAGTVVLGGGAVAAYSTSAVAASEDFNKSNDYSIGSNSQLVQVDPDKLAQSIGKYMIDNLGVVVSEKDMQRYIEDIEGYLAFFNDGNNRLGKRYTPTFNGAISEKDLEWMMKPCGNDDQLGALAAKLRVKYGIGSGDQTDNCAGPCKSIDGTYRTGSFAVGADSQAMLKELQGIKDDFLKGARDGTDYRYKNPDEVKAAIGRALEKYDVYIMTLDTDDKNEIIVLDNKDDCIRFVGDAARNATIEQLYDRFFSISNANRAGFNERGLVSDYTFSPGMIITDIDPDEYNIFPVHMEPPEELQGDYCEDWMIKIRKVPSPSDGGNNGNNGNGNGCDAGGGDAF